MQNLQISRVELVEALENTFELFVVPVNKISVYKACRFVKQVAIGFNIELITLLKFISFLYFAFNDERHIAEGKRNILSEDQPIMVLSVDSVAFIIAHFCIRIG